MALTIALPLSGIEPEHFYALGVRLLYDQGVRTLTGQGPASPSTGSESSGFSSCFAPSVDSSTPIITPGSSRPDTPNEDPIRPSGKMTQAIKVVYGERDILNLGANIREPSWQLRSPMMPSCNLTILMANRSIYCRLGKYALTEDYPTRNCKDCGFREPSPYLF
ncbi:uncharacterized protein LOC107273348 [Cephus cinctus]|uniref:Uncharacterized protein LOC107273348 n=1 Tax=Cephus cinctus TaxID=211228 RepID=A0AAJ7CC64_CEPCN|nr:uncharacterized protein LOC107273348 [Cephus cinctus]